MKFLMISNYGEGLQVLYNIGLEGNSVRAYIEHPDCRTMWRGLLPLITKPIPKEDEIVIFDSSGMGEMADKIAKHNPIFGGSKFADRLELDRQFGLDIMEKVGINVPDTKTFNSHQWNRAFDFLDTLGKQDKYVFKPSGAELPSKLSYVPCDIEDLKLYMKYAKQSYGHVIENFVLQKFIEGTIVSTEFWCDGRQFLRPANHTVEVKKLMNDELGPSTGCAGNLIWMCEENCWIVRDGIELMEEICINENYRGQIDLNTIVNDEGVWGLEWTPRFGYDSIPTILQLIDTDLGGFFSNAARGQSSGTFPGKSGFSGGVRLSIPPYPLEPPKNSDVRRVGPNIGIPIRGISEQHKKNCYFYEIMLDSEENIVHCEGSGAILVASSAAPDPESCFETPYKILKNCKISDKQYRTDLDQLLPKMYNEVQEIENARN